MTTSNNANYEDSSVISAYKKKDKLTPPEQTILNLIQKENLSSMLDIGVGTGRTTIYFAPIFKEYMGIDYSHGMVEASKERFSNFPEYRFELQDATDLSAFKENSFDFILFSFNGIDCVSYVNRLKILAEIKRVGKPGSYFAFSTHNIYNVPVLFSFQMPRNPFKYYNEYKRYKGVNKLNPPKEEILKNDFFSLFDGDINFSAAYLYYKPEKQISELNENNFENIMVFSLKTGKEIKTGTTWEHIKDPWLYFLCTIKK